MSKIEKDKKLKDDYYAFLDKKIAERKIALESEHYQLFTLSATFWLSILHSQREELVKGIGKEVEVKLDGKVYKAIIQ